MKSPFDILTAWIKYSFDRNILQRIKDFWLLRDYMEGNIWSKDFYKKHKKEVVAILDSLDKEKPDVQTIIEYFKDRGIYGK
jgi:hypothetical protein